jgi:hypothetical protein
VPCFAAPQPEPDPQTLGEDARRRLFWGDRYGIVVDPFGHSWSIATHQRDMTAEEILEAMQAAPCGTGKAC